MRRPLLVIRIGGDDIFPLESRPANFEEFRRRPATTCRELSIPTFIRERSADQNSRVAASASSASWFTTWKNRGVCPTNSPSAVNDAMVATAPPNWSLLGRITAQSGKFALMNSHGTGKMRLGWTSGASVKKLGNVRPWSETGATGGWTPLPEKSTHSRK